MSIYTTVANAVVSTIQGLGLTGIPNSNVLLLELPTDNESVLTAAGAVGPLPVCEVTKCPDPWQETGVLNNSDDWSVPLLVSFLDAANQSMTWSEKRNLWLETTIFAFYLKPLAGVIAVQKQIVIPRVTVDPSMFRDANLCVGQFLIRSTYRRAR